VPYTVARALAFAKSFAESQEQTKVVKMTSKVEKKICKAPNCDRISRANGACNMHHLRMRDHGSYEDPRKRKGSFINGYLRHSINNRIVGAHVLVAEKAIGRRLPKGAVVHHVNNNKLDNRPENLVICPNNGYHSLIHARANAQNACGNPDFRKCGRCKRYDNPALMNRDGKNSAHKGSCRNYPNAIIPNNPEAK